MTHLRRGIALMAGIVALLAMALAGSMTVAQHDHGQGTPDAHDGHMAATSDDHAGMTGTGVVYLTVTNDGDEDDALVGATTDRARAVEFHETRVQDSIGMMVPHPDPVTIPAGETVAFEPAGMHIMLVGLTDDIRLGDTFELTLTFEGAGEVTLPVTAVLDAEDAEGEPVEAGDLTIEGVWSRPAPMIDGVSSTPEATPES